MLWTLCIISKGVPGPIPQALPAAISDLSIICEHAGDEGYVASRGWGEAGGIVPGGETYRLGQIFIRLDIY